MIRPDTILPAVFAALVLSFGPAFAGDDHQHGDGKGEHTHTQDAPKAEKAETSHSHAGKHGGHVVESGHHHLEIVAKDGSIEVYVEGEDGKPEDLQGATASAAVLTQGKKSDVTLTQEGDRLKGTGEFKAEKGTIIVLTLTMAGHSPEQSRIKID